MRQGVKQVKLKWRITRADVERMLILVSAALVVALALRGDETAMSRYEQGQLSQNTAVNVTETAAQSAQDMQSVTVYYQGIWCLLPRAWPRQTALPRRP